MDIEIRKNLNKIKNLIKIGLKEDFGRFKDITSSAIFKGENGKCMIMSKEEGILCGIDIVEMVFKIVDKSIKFNKIKNDKDKLNKNDTIAIIEGKVKSLLEAERTSLNILGYLSGIATKTFKFVEICQNKTKILDTRKILPGYRILAKYAVRCGGGMNHRIGLYDMILIKDNHIDACGSITNAVEKVRKKYKNRFKIEVETRNLNEVKEAINLNVDRIMLDNMDFETAKKAIEMINNMIETEISGNMDEEKLKIFSELGPTYISIGALTHSVKVLDFSMLFIKN